MKKLSIDSDQKWKARWLEGMDGLETTFQCLNWMARSGSNQSITATKWPISGKSWNGESVHTSINQNSKFGPRSNPLGNHSGEHVGNQFLKKWVPKLWTDVMLCNFSLFFFQRLYNDHAWPSLYKYTPSSKCLGTSFFFEITLSFSPSFFSIAQNITFFESSRENTWFCRTVVYVIWSSFTPREIFTSNPICNKESWGK